jgi:hypothetical protein
VRHGSPIDADVEVIAEHEEFLFGELRAIVRDDRVWGCKAMDDVEEELHGLFRFDLRDWLGFYPLRELVHDDKQMRVAPGRLLEWPNQIEPLDHEWPCDGDHLNCFGWQVGLSSIVLTPFLGAHDLLNVSHRGRPVEALSKRIFD